MTIRNPFKSLSFLLTALFVQAQAIAQTKDLNVDVDINKGGDGGIGQYWPWIVGAAVFVLLLVVLLRGRK